MTVNREFKKMSIEVAVTYFMVFSNNLPGWTVVNEEQFLMITVAET
jgi:hypothetical protein